MNVIIGIDEVGRGPVAGPVAVGAFCFRDAKAIREIRGFGVPIRDSKKLTRIQREKWFAEIKIWKKQNKCDFCVTMIPASQIDKIGISKAIKQALAKSLYTLNPDFKNQILLDGGLRAPTEFKNQKTIIKGDEKYPVISFASIVAKVTRDKYMFAQAKKFSNYGFENHVGYGTRAHYEAIKKYGITKLHRVSFLKKML